MGNDSINFDRMSVLHLGWGDLSSSFGGVESVIANLIRCLTSLGMKIVHRRLPSTNPAFLMMGLGDHELSYSRFEEELRALVLHEDIRCIHSHNLHRPNGAQLGSLVIAICRTLDIPHVITVHDCGAFPTEDDYRVARAILANSICVATSPFNARELLDKFGVRVHAIVEPGIPFPAVIPNEPSSDLRTFCIPGRFTPAKGILEAIIAVGHLSRILDSVKVIVSNPAHVHYGCDLEYCRLIEAISLRFPEMEFEFYNGKAGFPDMYSGAAATIALPRHPEGFGLVPLESVVCARPAVAAPTGGMEWAKGWKSIAQSHISAPFDLIRTLESMLVRRHMWRQYLEEEYEVFRSRFDVRQSGIRYARIYEAATTGRHETL